MKNRSEPRGNPSDVRPRPRCRRLLFDLAAALAWVVGALGASSLLSGANLAQVSMIFFSAVVLASVTRGARAGIAAAFVAFAAYDYFWIPPIHMVELRTPYEAITLAMFLALALVTALASGSARDRERQFMTRQAMLLRAISEAAPRSPPRNPALLGRDLAKRVVKITGTGALFIDPNGEETRAGEAEIWWWDTVHERLKALRADALRRPGRTRRAGTFRARALFGGGEPIGTLIWHAPNAPRQVRRETDDYVAAVADVAATSMVVASPGGVVG